MENILRRIFSSSKISEIIEPSDDNEKVFALIFANKEGKKIGALYFKYESGAPSDEELSHYAREMEEDFGLIGYAYASGLFGNIKLKNLKPLLRNYFLSFRDCPGR